MKKFKLWFSILSLTLASAHVFADSSPYLYYCSGWYSGLHVKALNIGAKVVTMHYSKYMYVTFNEDNRWFKIPGAVELGSEGESKEVSITRLEAKMLMQAQKNNLPVSFSCDAGNIDSLYVGQ